MILFSNLRKLKYENDEISNSLRGSLSCVKFLGSTKMQKNMICMMIQCITFQIENLGCYSCGHHAMQIIVHTPPYNFVMLYIFRNSKKNWPHFIQKECYMRNKHEERAFQINGVRDVTCVNVQLTYLVGPREVCVCITYSREAWIEGVGEGAWERQHEK